MGRKILMILTALMLAATACSDGGGDGGGDGPQTYAVDIDAASAPPEAHAQYSAFFPGSLKVAAGDTIRFRNRASEAPHTVTFGVEADRSNAPPPIVPEGENPAVLNACDVDDDPSPQTVKCETTELGAYDGTGYWNSGFLYPQPAPREAGPKTTTLELSDDIEPGSYTFVCILHGMMNGTLEVVDEDERQTPEEVRAASESAAAEVKETAEGIKDPKLERDGDEVTVAAGWGDNITSINRFSPAEVEIEPGTTVKWQIDSPYEPHTVTFDPPFEGLEDPRAFSPEGVADGEEYTGGFTNSGFMGKQGAPFDSFTLTFPEEGTYEYLCVLHPGMEGTVSVG